MNLNFCKDEIFTATNYKPCRKGTKICEFDLTIEKLGLTLTGLTYHEHNDKQWVGIPGRNVPNLDHPLPALKFASNEAQVVFKSQALAALRSFLDV